MKTKRFHLLCSVQLLLIDKEKILLLRRFNTGWMDGKHGLVAGHIDGGEDIKKAMIREAKEESGITINEKDLDVVHTMHRISNNENGNIEYIDIFFTAGKWTGKPYVAETNRADEVAWYSLNKLPTTLMGHIKQAIDMYQKKINYSTFGFNGEEY